LKLITEREEGPGGEEHRQPVIPVSAMQQNQTQTEPFFTVMKTALLEL
jgi:hypothetical protein